MLRVSAEKCTTVMQNLKTEKHFKPVNQIDKPKIKKPTRRKGKSNL